MADRTLARDVERYDVLARRIAGAANGNPAAAASSLSEPEFTALADLASAPRRILTAGPGAAHAALMLALVHPDADVVAIDPDIPAADAADLARRIDLHGRLHTETGSFASGAAGKRPIGPEICAAEEDFDLILIDGAADSASRAADLRLAASAVAPGGVIAMRGVMGRSAATVRAGVFDFLRYNSGFHYLALQTPGASGGIGLLRARAAAWFHGAEAPAPAKPGDVSEAIQAGLGEQIVSMAGNAQLVEASVGAPLLGSVRRKRDSDVLLHVSPAEAAASYVDPVVDRVADALNGGVLFSGDLADFASDELLTRLFDRLADRNAAGIFAVTPPGEPGVAGPASRPAARLIDLAASQGLAAYAPAGLEFETVRHADAQAAVSSRHLSLLMFARAGGRRDAAGRLLVERTPAAAAQYEQVELQRLVDQSALQADAARHLAERERAETRELDIAERLKDKTKALDIANDALERARRTWESEHVSLREELRTQTDLTSQLKETLDTAEATLLREHKLRQEFETDALRRIKALETELEQAREAHSIEAERLRWDTAAADAREQAARERLGQSRDEVAQLHDDLRTAQGALKSLGESDRLMRQRAEAAEAKIAAALQQAAEMKAQSAQAALQADRELSRVKMSLADEASRGQRLMADVQAANAEAERLRADLRTASERYTQLTTDHAAARESEAKGVAEIARLRADHASEIDRVRQAALANAARPEDMAELKALREGKARLEADIDARRREVDDLQKRLSNAVSNAVDQACREVDLAASLAGVDAHLALSQEALEKARQDPQGYRLADQAYPQGARIDSARGETGQDLIETAHALHGRAADLSRDLGKTLEQAEARRQAALDAIRVSHEAALSQLQETKASTERPRSPQPPTVVREDAPEQKAAPLQAPAIAPANVQPSLDPAPSSTENLRDHHQRMQQLLRQAEAPAAFPPPPQPAEPVAQIETKIAAPAPGAQMPAEESDQFVRIVPTPQPAAEVQVAPDAEPLEDEPKPTRKVIDDLTIEDHEPEAPELVMTASDVAPERRTFAKRIWDWLRAYRETFNLVRLQKTLDAHYARGSFRAKLFDADYYRSQGPIPEGQDALQHYLLIGEAEGRRPLYGFDPVFYRRELGAGEKVSGSLLRHFLETGVDDGLSPSADLEPIARRAMAASQSRLEYFLRREDEVRKKRIALLPIRER